MPLQEEMAWKSCGALLLDRLVVALEHERIETATAFVGAQPVRRKTRTVVELESINSYFYPGLSENLNEGTARCRPQPAFFHPLSF